MHAFVIFAFFALASARPDVSHLQHHQVNHAHGGGSASGYSAGSGSSAGGSNYVQTQGRSFGGSSAGLSDFGGASGGSFGGASSGSSSGSFGGASSGSFGGSSSGSFGGASSGGFGGASSGSFSGASSSSGSSGANFIDGGVHQGQTQVFDLSSGGGAGNSVIYKPVVRQGPPQIIKSFYIHEAPEDAPANVEVREKEINVRPQKHYKIIFIKLPASQAGGAFGGNAAIFPQNEEKTIVYVLSKKADGGISENGEFPTPPPAVTSKPDVFFVKYRTEGEAAGAISSIQESFQEGGAGFNNPAQFAQNIGASSGSASASSFSQSGSSSGGSFGGSSSGSFGGSSSGSFGGSSSGSFGGASSGSFGGDVRSFDSGSSSGGSFGGSSGGSFGGSSGGSFGGSSASFGGSSSGSVGSHDHSLNHYGH